MRLTIFLAPLGELNAHLYASFHSGRDSQRPISRHTIKSLTGVPWHTQQRYEKLAHVKTTKNYAVGPQFNSRQQEEHLWQHGCATFTYTDYRGLYGRKGQKYLAWQLPNTYRGPHSRCSQNKKKLLNCKLDLVIDRE